jgi:hypothetical protein
MLRHIVAFIICDFIVTLLKINAMKPLHLILYVLILSTASCKKKVEVPPTTNNTATNNPNSHHALLRVSQSMYVTSAFTFTGGGASAVFSSNAMIGSGTVGGQLDAGQVMLNSTILKKDGPSNPFYYDSTGTSYTPPVDWFVSGSSTVPSFSQSVSGAYPVFTGTAGIQSSITLSQGATIALSGITGADEIEVILFSSNLPVTKTLSGSSTSVNFTASELSSVGTGTAGMIMVTASKSSIVAVGGKNFKFQLCQQFTRGDVVYN